MHDFRGRHVVITGGTGALGAAVTARLLGAGATCHIPCFKEAEVDAFPHAGHERVSVATGVDLTAEREVESFYSDLPDLWASVHCAGGFAMGALAEAGLDDFEGQLRLNLVTAFLCCREAVRRMTGRGGGRIVNVAARPALEPRLGAGMTAYTSAKAALAALTQALAEEVVAHGILVNAVAPSVMDTPANRKAMPKADHSTWPSTDDVAATIAFLASPANTCTRGGVVPVYGRA